MAENASTDDAPAKHSKSYRTVVLAMLFLVYAFNFLDRQIISILAIPIKDELGLSDEQLGLLGGIAFALLYSTLGVPIAWLADRMDRTWVMTISLTVWSAFTALSGFAQNFMHLFLARVGVGVGEAGGVAPAYTIIADYNPPAERARALAIYSLGIPVGSAFGVIAGSLIASGAFSENLDWRSAFIIVGLAGVVVAPLFKFLVKEPVRGQYDAQPVTSPSEKPEVGPLSQKKAKMLALRGAVILAAPSLLSVFNILLFGANAAQPIWMLLLAAAVGAGCGWYAGGLWARNTNVIRIILITSALVLLPGLVAWIGGALVTGAELGWGAFAWLMGRAIAGMLLGAFFFTFRDFLDVTLEKHSFWLMVAGASASSMMGYGIFFWLPSFFSRTFDLGLVQTGWVFGGVLFVAGSLGIVLGGVMGDWMGKRSRSAFAIVPAIAFIFTAPFYWLGIMSPTVWIATAFMFVPTALGLAWLGPVLSAFQHLVPPDMRTRASSVFLLINNLVGIGGGVYVLGRVSTVLEPQFGEDSLRMSILAGSMLYIVAAVFFWLASRYLVRDWVED